MLPYHCPVLKGDYLRPPCQGQVAPAREYRRKFAYAIMPYGLEQCLKCGGKDLVVRAAPEGGDLGPPRRENGEGEIPPNPPLIKGGIKTGTAPKDKGMGTAVKFKSEAEAERVLGPGKVPAELPNPGAIYSEIIPEAPGCPKHPQEPQIQCGPDSKRSGQYLGACKICMAERKTDTVWKRKAPKDKMTPAVARDMGLVPKAPSRPPLGPGMEPGLPDEAALAGPVPRCKKHPARPARIDKLGRSMGLCDECVAARGRRFVAENKRLGRNYVPVNIPLNDPQYAALKVWLEEQAAELEQKLPQQIMYRLKLAMREATK